MRGEKTIALPIFHNSYPRSGDFLISVSGVCPVPQQGKGKGHRGPAQVPQAQDGPASLRLGLCWAWPKRQHPRPAPKDQPWSEVCWALKHQHFTAVTTSQPQPGTWFGESGGRVPERLVVAASSWPGHKFKQSPVENVAECQCLFMSWQELRPLCQARTTSTSFKNAKPPLDCNSENSWVVSHVVQPSHARVHSARRAGTAGVVAFTSEASSVYSCLHAQHTQETGDLPPLSTSAISTASLPSWINHLCCKEKSQRSSLPLHSYTVTGTAPGERGALASKPCSIFSGKSNLDIAQSKGCTQIRAGQTDRQDSDPRGHIPSLLHTQGARTAPGPAPQTVQMGNVPIPLKPVLRSQECLNLEHVPETPESIPGDLALGHVERDTSTMCSEIQFVTGSGTEA